MKLEKLAAAALLTIMALPLTGCPVFPSSGMPYTPAPYPYNPPVADRLNGPSLGDAFHDVEKWLASHYPDARLVAVDGPAVGRSGRSGGKGWTFKYAVQSKVEPQPQPRPWPTPQPKPTRKPKWVLEPGEEYGPPAQDDGMATTDAALIGNSPYLRYDDELQDPPVLRMPPIQNPDPDQGRPWPADLRPQLRYMAITVDGSGRLLAPEDVAAPDGGSSEASLAGAPYPAPDDPAFLGDRLSILPMPMPVPEPQALDFKRTVSLLKLLATIEDLGNRIGPAGVRVSIKADAGRGAVVEIDPQVAMRGSAPTRYPTYGPDSPEPADGPYGPEPADGPYYASDANRKPGYGVKCYAPPSQPGPYETGSDGVLYRGTFLFNAYTGELLARPARI